MEIYFAPPLLLPFPEAPVWTVTGGGFSPEIGAFTAASNAANATVTVQVRNATLQKHFIVLEPSGYDAQITGTQHYSIGTIGAGMTDLIHVHPTEVSFYRVNLVELPCSPENITGYFENVSFQPTDLGSAELDENNSFIDEVASVVSDPFFPLYPGEYVINVPVKWQIRGSSQTNNFGVFTSLRSLLNSSGDFRITKYSLTMTRTTNDVCNPNP